MKNLKIIIAAFLVLSFLGCDKEDAPINTVYDNVNGQGGVGFDLENRSVIVPPEGITVNVAVRTTTISSQARTFNVSVDESSTGSSQDYTIGALTIPADSYFGTFQVTFGNFDNLPDLVNNTLVVNLDLPEGVSVVGSESVTFTYLKAIVCNDVVFVLNEDAYADERDWRITDSTGAIVVQCSDYADCPNGAPSGSIPAMQYEYEFFLADGCYTLTVFDSFGDGMFDGAITGNYALTCSIITHASGSGNFGGSQSTEFCINQ